MSYSQIAFLYLGCLGLTCGRYLRLVGGETVCGNLGGLFVGFLFDRANNVHDSFTGGNALQRRITQSFLLNFMQLVPDPQNIGKASRTIDATCERLRIQCRLACLVHSRIWSPDRTCGWSCTHLSHSYTKIHLLRNLPILTTQSFDAQLKLNIFIMSCHGPVCSFPCTCMKLHKILALMAIGS